MGRPAPAAALNGTRTGHICDSCSRRIEHGDKAGMYATWYDDGWLARRTWCLDCCPETIEHATDGADEALLVGILFAHRMVSTEERHRSSPVE